MTIMKKYDSQLVLVARGYQTLEDAAEKLGTSLSLGFSRHHSEYQGGVYYLNKPSPTEEIAIKANGYLDDGEMYLRVKSLDSSIIVVEAFLHGDHAELVEAMLALPDLELIS
jgi:hypothetical protein